MRSRAREEGLSDAQILARVGDGEPGALGILFDRYDQDVRRVVARLGVREADVDDIVQATFLDVMRAAPSFDGRVSAKSWLVGIAVMLVRRHRRSLGRMAQRLAAWALEPAPRSERTPAELLETNDSARRAHAALDCLAPKKREVFVLVALEGMSGEQASASLGVPIATIWTRLHYARRELREALLREDT